MKKVNLAAAVAMTLFSAAAFAEQGSGQLNQIGQPASSAQYSHGELTMAPADLTAVNGHADAMNDVMQVSAPTATLTQSDLTPAYLTGLNGDEAKNEVMDVSAKAEDALAHDFTPSELNEFNS